MNVETKLAIWEELVQQQEDFPDLFAQGTPEVRQHIAAGNLDEIVEKIHEVAADLGYDAPLDWELIPAILPIIIDADKAERVIIPALSKLFGSRISFDTRIKPGESTWVRAKVDTTDVHVCRADTSEMMVPFWEIQISQHENHHRLEPLRELIKLARAHANGHTGTIEAAEKLLAELEE